MLLTVLVRLMKERFSEQYEGVELKLCAVDEGIEGYRKESLECVWALEE